jgi:hypothetical protein
VHDCLCNVATVALLSRLVARYAEAEAAEHHAIPVPVVPLVPKLVLVALVPLYQCRLLQY